MHLHKYEKIWLTFGFAALIIFLSVVGVSAFHQGNTPSGGLQKVDPDNLDSTPPFDKPGVHKKEDGSYEVIVVAEAFGYTPGEIQVPAGEKVTFKVTSKDVTHSFSIVETNVNMMVVPGQVNEKTHTFRKPGTYLIVCNEYCGSGHHFMSMEIEVVNQ